MQMFTDLTAGLPMCVEENGGIFFPLAMRRGLEIPQESCLTTLLWQTVPMLAALKTFASQLFKSQER